MQSKTCVITEIKVGTMNQPKIRTPKKGAVKKMRELYEKNRGKASKELLKIINTPSSQDEENKKSASTYKNNDMEL